MAVRALVAFTRLDRLFTLRSKYANQKANRARLEMTPLEERVVPDGTQVNLAWLADGAEPGTPAQFRLTRVADQATIDGAGLTVALQLTGTAVRGTDYTVPGDTTETLGDPVLVTFEPGQSTADLSLAVIDDALNEGRESVAAQLLAGQDYDIGTANPVSAWVADDELWIEADADPVLRGQEVTFSLPQYAVGVTGIEWDANYDGTTFQPVANETAASFTTTFTTSGNRVVAARVTDANSNAQIVTLDVTVAPAGTAVTLEWVADGAEPGTTGTLRFTRTVAQAEIDANPLTVTFLTGGTATPGTDYTLVGASDTAPAVGSLVTITFAAGQSTADLSVAVSDDAESEGWESVTAQLQAGTGYTAETADPVTVWLADDELWLEADADPVFKGQEVTFWLPEDAEGIVTVEWDANYDGATFQPQAGANDMWLATTFTAAGTFTVAARVTDANEVAQIITLNAVVENPPPELTVPADLTAVVGVPVPLVALADAESGIASVEWSFSYYSDDYEWYFETDPTLTDLSEMYTFAWAGEYDVQVKVTDNNEKSSEGWFHVSVTNAAPTAAPVVATRADGSPLGTGINEGQSVTFTIAELDPDALDTVTVYADWLGTGEYIQLYEGDFTVTADGSVSVTHQYDDNSTTAGEPNKAFATKFWLEDEWGAVLDLPAVNVVVRNIAPVAILSPGPAGGTEASALTRTGIILRQMVAGGNRIAFIDVVDSAADVATLRYHWKVTDVNGENAGDETEFDGGSALDLPDYRAGHIYKVEAYIEDKDGGKTEFPLFYAVVNAPNMVSGDWPTTGTAGTVFMFGAPPWSPEHLLFGSLFLHNDGTATASAAPTGYNWAGFAPQIEKTGEGVWKPGGDVPSTYTAEFKLTADSLTHVASLVGATVAYQIKVSVYDVERSSWWDDNFELLSSETFNTSAVEIPWPGQDRRIEIEARAYLVRDGQTLGSTIPWYDCTPAWSHRIVIETEKTPTTLEHMESLAQALQGVLDLAAQFGNNAQQFVAAITSNPGRVIDILSKGLLQGVEHVGANLLTTGPAKLAEWLGLPGSALPKFLTPGALDTPEKWGSFLLEYAGLTWDNVMNLVRQQLGAGTLAALDQVFAWFNKDGQPIDPSSPNAIAQLLTSIKDKLNVEQIAFDVDVNQLLSQARDKITAMIPGAIAKAGVQLASKFVPGAGMFLTLYKGLQWLLANQTELTSLFTQFSGIIADLNPDKLDPNSALYDPLWTDAAAIAAVKGKVAAGLEGAMVPVLRLAAGQLGLGALPDQMKKALAFVPTKVEEALRKAVAAVAGKVVLALPGGSNLPNGTIASKALASPNQDYLLAAVQDGKDVRVELYKKDALNQYKRFGTGLTDKAFTTFVLPTAQGGDTKTAKEHMTAFAAAAKAVSDKSRQKPTATVSAATIMAELKVLKAAYPTAEARVLADIAANACIALQAGCFATGTKLLTKRGWVAVELLEVGDEVAARHESEPTGEVEWKPIEATFRRTGRILHLHFPSGELIRTTPEHPFWVEGKGWTAAGAIREGDRIATLVGDSVAVSEVFDTEQWEPVYNIRVADFHTYFVGEETWGFSVWAHNAYMPNANQYYVSEGSSYASSARTLYTLLQSYAPSVIGTIAYSVSISDPELAYIYVYYKPSTMTSAQAQAFRDAFADGAQVVFIPGGGDNDHAERQLFLQRRNDIRAIGISNAKGPCGRPVQGGAATGCWKFFQDSNWENVWW